jgi:hypothetical protein
MTGAYGPHNLGGSATVDLPRLGHCSARASDAWTPERQTRCVSVCRSGFHGWANVRATDAQAASNERSRDASVDHFHEIELSVLRLSG